jgi:exopolysaccharide biosynthesis polyprenyl glycosylphosphotransferase
VGYPELGYDIVSVLNVPPEPGDDGAMHVRLETVEGIVREKKIGLIVFSSANLNGSFDQLEGFCKRRRIAMRVVSPESDYLFSRARLHDIAGIPLFSPERRRITLIKAAIKRCFDIVGSIIALTILSPVFLFVAVATKLESHGPVFFRQKRSLTDQDEPFEFYKFRSMIHSADEQKESLLHRNESSGALFKIKNDPRLTRVGRFIRKYSIDELPQLINVLKGEMSLVGPRPLPACDFALLQDEDHMGGYYRQRAKAKPGMTGLWQISGRSDLGFREMVLLDLYYIEKQSVLFDVEILAQTLPVVLFGRGAY